MKRSMFVRVAVPMAALLSMILTCATGQSGEPPAVLVAPSAAITAAVVHLEPVVEALPTEPEPVARCPEDMALVGDACMDLYEAPNKPGERPLVMMSALDAEDWCSKQGKRVCTDDEWSAACEGPEHWRYPYGDKWEPGRCNDDKRWRARDEDKLNVWPKDIAKREVERLWQGSLPGEHPDCAGPYGIYDLAGNVEEWTRRKDPSGQFRHSLRGRFWAGGGWTCQQIIQSHADQFFYYETGTRCCL